MSPAAALLALVLSLFTALPLHAQGRAAAGEWSALFPWPLVAVHLHVLPDGRILTWGGADDAVHAGGSEAYLWTPATGLWTAVPNPTTNIFCAGHAFLPDGRLLVIGGHVSPEMGVPDANVFDSRTSAWSSLPPMNLGRWYPTATTLTNGEVLAISGFVTPELKNNVPQVWQVSGGWRTLLGAVNEVPLYPWTFATAKGQAYMAGPNQVTRFLNPSGAGKWKAGPSSLWGTRIDGTSAMYEEGRILIAGGGRTFATATAEIIDLHAATPAWHAVAPMAFARRHFNSTILADGEVLVTGGSAYANDTTQAVLPAEIWNPQTESWTTVAPLAERRLYHSTAVLLPDGRVLVAGGGASGKGDTDHLNAQIYSPPYLFAADGHPAVRPVISAAPASVGYGAKFVVETPDHARIARVNWIRLSSVTHSYNMNQRLNHLVFTEVRKGVKVTAPIRDQAPPGDYLLFLLDASGVPSVGRVVHLG